MCVGLRRGRDEQHLLQVVGEQREHVVPFARDGKAHHVRELNWSWKMSGGNNLLTGLFSIRAQILKHQGKLWQEF